MTLTINVSSSDSCEKSEDSREDSREDSSRDDDGRGKYMKTGVEKIIHLFNEDANTESPSMSQSTEKHGQLAGLVRGLQNLECAAGILFLKFKALKVLEFPIGSLEKP